MLFVSEYTLKPHMEKSDVKHLMDIFGTRGAGEGELAHYVRADGTGGYTIIEADSVEASYADVLAYSEFISFKITPVMKVDDALAPIAEYLGG